jgi:cobaltochelatase CobS subunit
MATEAKDSSGHLRVECLLCKAAKEPSRFYHRLDVHLVRKHGTTAAEYAGNFPGSATISDYARSRAIAPPPLAEAKATKTKKAETVKADPTARAGSAANPFKFKSGVHLCLREHLTPADRSRVPDHDPNWEMDASATEKWECYAIAVAERENLLDVGPTGCGKTAGIFQFAATLNQPVIRFNLSGDARVAQFVGEKAVDIDHETKQAIVVWRDGVLTQAMRNGWWLILDEVDSCPPQILFVLHSVLEKGGTLTLAENGGERVVPHPSFRVFASANTLGRGDDSGLYEGTNVLNEAFLDRFGIVLQSDYPDATTEVNILVSKAGIAKPEAQKMRKVAEKVREGLKNEECECTFSTRRLIAWATKSKFMPAPAAAKITILNKLSGDDKVFVGDIIQRYFGGEVS